MQLLGKFGWLMCIFQLDCCLFFSCFVIVVGLELVVINVYLLVYDKGGVLKK